MTESVGVSSQAALPTDQVKLLQLLIIEMRVIQFYLKESTNITDEPYKLRNDLLNTAEVSITYP
jgi:hypothetical protein